MTDPAARAAAEALAPHLRCGPPWSIVVIARDAVAAARPIIEAEVRERIAAEIEAMLTNDDTDAAVLEAARIARGRA